MAAQLIANLLNWVISFANHCATQNNHNNQNTNQPNQASKQVRHIRTNLCIALGISKIKTRNECIFPGAIMSPFAYNDVWIQTSLCLQQGPSMSTLSQSRSRHSMFPKENALCVSSQSFLSISSMIITTTSLGFSYETDALM